LSHVPSLMLNLFLCAYLPSMYHLWCLCSCLLPPFLLNSMFVCLFCSTGVWTQGLHLDSLHLPFFVMGYLEIGFCELFAWGWLWTEIPHISSSWVIRIKGVSHQGPTVVFTVEFWGHILWILVLC
jgi:hypothetical protein